MAHDNIGLPLSDEPSNRSAILDSRQQLSVMNVQDFGRDSQNLCSLFHFGFTPPRQGTARVSPMTDIPVGYGYELDMVSLGRPHDSHSSGPEFAIIGMCAKADNS
jgi:hypothetical protein